MPTTKKYDYIIIGGGLAGLQLTLALINDTELSRKAIAIIEPSEKVSNDKTWCYWEKGKGKWDKIVHHEWKAGAFKSQTSSQALNMGDYSYKMIRSADFYCHAKKVIGLASNVNWIQDEISNVSGMECIGTKGNYTAKYVFDSRIPSGFIEDKKHIQIKQPFKGWLIKTDKAQFDSSVFTMMDYTIQFQNKCCFTYVLPISATEALVEFTFFVPELVDESVYDTLLHQFISERLKIETYSISEVEKGIVPMSSYPFWKDNRKNYLRIGTAGGWVKASSGYSFKSSEKKIEQLIKNLKSNRRIDFGLFKKRFRFYDRILLRILQNENHLGSRIFQEMYSRNSTAKIFKFLDEETNLAEEIKIINNFRKGPFMRSFLKEIK